MSYEITSILNTRNRDYRRWIHEQLLSLRGKNPFKDFKNYCPLDYYNCLSLNRVVGKGGGSKIIEANFVAGERCDTLFNVSPSYKLAVKLCSFDYLDQLSCRDLAKEIRNLLHYSQLFVNRICENFLYCMGYGIDCCLLVSDKDLEVQSHTDLKNYQILKDLNYNIEDYFEALNDTGCDTFILMNLVTGPDLSTLKSGFQLTVRQTFEYVYSLLCSVIFLQAIPDDIHLDNFMFNRTKKKVVITIGSQNIYFTTTTSIVHIDYQVMKDRDDLSWGDVFLSEHLHKDYRDSIQQMFRTTKGPIRKVEALAELFKECHIDMNRVDSENTTLLRFSTTLGN